jgi:uncharacterized protein YbbC (DUF1343 family)
MTLGEIARWLNDVAAIGAQLTVVPVRGWRRGEWPVARGIAPPRLRNEVVTPEQLLLHSSVAALTATNLRYAFGPGKTVVRVGAPWLDVRRLASVLNDRLIPGVEFSAGRDEFDDGSAGWRTMPSLRASVTNRESASAVRILTAVMAVARTIHPDSLTIDRAHLTALSGSAAFAQAIAHGEDSDAIVDRDLVNVIAFRRRVRSFLLY